MIRYQCNANFEALEADLTNECVANSNGNAPADWSRSEANLSNVCQPGNCHCVLSIYAFRFHIHLR